MHASTPCNVNKASKVHHTAGKPLISHNFLSFLIIYRNLATHGLFFFTPICVAVSMNRFMACMSHILVKTKQKEAYCRVVLARSLQKHFIYDLTCAVTPTEPHMFQLGKLHSVLHSNEATSRVAKDHPHNRHTGLCDRRQQK